MPGEAEIAVTQAPDAASGESNLVPDAPSVEAADTAVKTEGNAPARVENAIPHFRVKEMLSKQEREWKGRLEAYEKQAQGWNNFSESMLKGLGLKEPEKPQYIDKSQFDQFTQQMEQKLNLQRLAIQAEAELTQAKRGAHGWAFKLPGFETAVYQAWSRQGEKSLSEVVDDLAKEYDAALKSRQKAYLEQKKKDQETVVVKSGGGTPAPIPQRKGPSTKDSRVAKMVAMARALKGEDSE